MVRTRFYRFLELIPGSLVWLTLFFAISMSFVRPLWVMYFIILFDLLWLTRVSYFVFYLLFAWRRHKRDIAVDWQARVEPLDGYREIRHLIFLPTYNESIEIIRPTLESLATSKYPASEQLIVVLAGEARAGEARFNEMAAQLQAEFAGRFNQFVTTLHPTDLPDEIPGKGSNLNYAGNWVKENVIDPSGHPYDKVIVSSFDCDTVVHPQYFAHLTFKYLTHPNPTRSSYQPVALYNNNMWDSPAPVRIAAFGTTFWLFTELARPERMFTFASHSMPWQMLVDVGFWQKDIVTEDSRIFLQGLLHYNGDYEVTPLYVPVSMDTVMTGGYKDSLVALYKQQRRWAWGVEHFPYLVHNFARRPNFPWRKKAYHLFNVVEGMYSWATAPLLIFILGYLPLWVAPQSLKAQAFYQNTPHTLELLMTLSMAGILFSGLVSLTMLPPRPAHHSRWTWLILICQWALMPITFIVFGALPAVDAQTRLMLGKYMGFNVTDKQRKSQLPTGAAPAASD
jgi:cellulose synthase/poly-beta-1,6-N-acetylglucosamine synthase-like glycosyltransferase